MDEPESWSSSSLNGFSRLRDLTSVTTRLLGSGGLARRYLNPRGPPGPLKAVY